MASGRSEYLRILEKLCSDSLEVQDIGDGWPGLGQVKTSTGLMPVAIHVAPVGPSHRGRDEVERRFQNPGQDRPILAPHGMQPLLLGVWEEGGQPVLVGADPTPRVGRTTRFSIFVPLAILEQARTEGWADHHSTSDELIVAFHPALLPVYLEARVHGEVINADEVHRLLEATGLLEGPEDVRARERARRVASQLVRASGFGRALVKAYGGFCAMCGLDFGLLEGAHIYPASAPGSQDQLWNGLALCGNHHLAFDKHLVWVHPMERRLKVHPDLMAEADRNTTCMRFLEVTNQQLRDPEAPAARPREEMFEKRYDYFGERYDWVEAG